MENTSSLQEACETLPRAPFLPKPKGDRHGKIDLCTGCNNN